MKRFAFIALFAALFAGTGLAQQPEPAAEPVADSIRVSTPELDISVLSELEFIKIIGEKIQLDSLPLFVVDGKPMYPLTSDNIEYLMAINPDRLNALRILKPDTATGMWGEPAANGAVVLELLPECPVISEEEEAEMKVQSDMIRMFDWVSAHLEYPQWAYERMFEIAVPVTFTVEKDGKISDARCEANLKNVPMHQKALVKEAVRSVASAPKWYPAPESRTHTTLVQFDMPDFAPNKKPIFLWEAENKTEDKIYEFRERLQRWLGSQITIPEDFKISVSFIIEKFGSVSNVKVISTSNKEIAAKVVATLERSPKWTPGLGRDGQPVRTFLYSRLRFKDKDETEVSDSEEIDKDGVLPLFNGSNDLNVFRNWVMKKIVYPLYAYSEGIQGRVLISFIVEKDGKMVIEEIIHSPNDILTKEVMRVVKKSPKWTPGHRKDGKPVRVYYILPIDFMLR